MTKPSSPVFRNIDYFDSRVVQSYFPHIDIFQISPGQFKGWLFSAQMKDCRVTVGGFNQLILCEGHYNPDTLHIGFILNPKHSAMVQAHEYDDGTLTIHRNAIAMHEVYPADLIWVDIAIPEKRVSDIIPGFVIKKISERSQIFLEGSRETLSPLFEWVHEALDSPTQLPAESELLSNVAELLSNRLVDYDYNKTFTSGDLFRMHILDTTHELMGKDEAPRPLAEICAMVDIKPRTLQKYFHQIYGMGPTEYFRLRRLNCARCCLLKGANQVSEVAHQWGFSHLGRFAIRYKAHFGESPKETIQRN